MGKRSSIKKADMYNRSFNFKIRTEETERGSIIIGRPIVYDSVTDIGGMFNEVIHQDALDGTDLKDVRFLVNHDMNSIPLARSRNNNSNSTMQMRVDDGGMEVEVILDTENNTEAKNLYSAVSRGDVSGMSFWFSIEREEWEELESEKPTRHIYQIGTVLEVSAVTFPAYEDTTINARNQNGLESPEKALESARSSIQRKKSLESKKIKVKKLKNRIKAI